MKWYDDRYDPQEPLFHPGLVNEVAADMAADYPGMLPDQCAYEAARMVRDAEIMNSTDRNRRKLEEDLENV